MGATVKIAPTTLEEAQAALDGNSRVLICNNTYLVAGVNGHVFAEYHGNRIGHYTEHGLYASWAGWGTSTTTTRLNQLFPGHGFTVKKGEGYVDGEETGLTDWVKVA